MRKTLLSAFMALCVPAMAGAANIDLTGQSYMTYGNLNSYSLPISAQFYSWANGGSVGPGNPYYVDSTPGSIKDDVVIYTGANGVPVTTNVAGFDNAYGAPNGTKTYASISGAVNVIDPGNKAGIANNDANTWDASLLALKSFLGGGMPLFLFNNNDTNEDQNLAIWAKLWITNSAGAPVSASGHDYLYLSNLGLPYGAGGVLFGDATLYNPGNIAGPTAGFAATDYVLSGGQVVVSDGTHTATINHNLGANQAAYAGDVPLLNLLLADLFSLDDAILDDYTLHLDVHLGCVSVTAWGQCDDVKIDNGYEQLFLVANHSGGGDVPEPGVLALTAVALASLAWVYRRMLVAA